VVKKQTMNKRWRNTRNFKEVLQFFPTAEVYVTSSKRQHGFGNDGGGGDIDDVELINVLRTDYQYKYNGKEFQDELGLNMYAMDMRQYDPAIARWVVMDPVIHHSVSPYNAFDNNPVFWADPSGAAVDSFLELYEREKNHEHLIQRLLYDKTNEFIMEGGIGFFNGDPTNNYPSPGEEGSPENPIILEPAMLRPPNSFTAVALRAYANSYNGPQFSPYNPDAMSVNIGASGNLYYLNYDVSLSLILSPGNISGGINVGGGLGINSNMPFKNISLFSPYASVGFHDMYGGETNVIDGLRGWSTTTTYSGGPVFLSTSTSSKFYRPNQILPPASYGTKSTYFGYSPRGKNLGVSGFSSYTWIRSLKN
jgi:RHS repeat-associated protein